MSVWGPWDGNFTLRALFFEVQLEFLDPSGHFIAQIVIDWVRSFAAGPLGRLLLELFEVAFEEGVLFFYVGDVFGFGCLEVRALGGLRFPRDGPIFRSF